MAAKKKKNRKNISVGARETGTIVKKWQDHLSVALVYPNGYAVGMSSLGFQTVYQLINQSETCLCERFFLPDGSFDLHTKLLSVESMRPLRQFAIVAFSLSFENDYSNILSILEMAEIPFLSTERDASFPLIIAGGVASFLNPEPISPFIDAFLLGEAEVTIPDFLRRAVQFDLDDDMDRKSFLEDSSRLIPGFYVPFFYHEKTDEKGVKTGLATSLDIPMQITRPYLADISSLQTASTLMTTETAFGNVYLIEVSRGCPHGCRFCAAGYVYRPFRYRSFSMLSSAVEDGSRLSQHIGLVGAAVTDIPYLSDLCLLGEEKGIRFSFSSLRADRLDERLSKTLAKGDVKTATIAPEAGSERMRRVINKGITEAQILDAAGILVENGILNLKLYFMIGLPTETDSDISEIVSLVKKIKTVFLERSRENKRIGTITVGIHPFVPKPFTPFQWVAMEREASLKSKVKRISDELRKVPNVVVHGDSIKGALLQAILARGGRLVSELLLLAHQNKGNWPKTFKESSLDIDSCLYRERSKDEWLPWDFIDHGLRKSYLWDEYEKALKARSSPSCRYPSESCRICGVCER